MLTAANRASDGNYTRYLFIYQLDTQSLNRAKEIFIRYQRQGVIKNSCFEDSVWETTDERQRVRIRFDFSEPVYQKMAGQWLGCTSVRFQETMKAYILFQFGTLALNRLRKIANAFCHLAAIDAEHAALLKKDTKHIIELLRLLPGYSRAKDAVLENLEESLSNLWAVRHADHRQLADFQSYFRFHDELEKYWNSAFEQDKLFFFPVYLWWNLTAVLPLRPTEFLLLPRECLCNRAGEYWITVRRTKLKGGGQQLAYQIDLDYEKMEYPISEKLAESIIWYQEKSRYMEPSLTGSLFRRNAHYRNQRILSGMKEGYSYSYTNLKTCLRLFYRDVLADRDDISVIQLGDTRHIAMMNLIISGGSPVICKELAGHENINVSSNYYANLSAFVECAAYEQYRKSRDGSRAVLKGTNRYFLEPKQDMVRLPDGWCASLHLKDHAVYDCISSINIHGEVGDCQSCRFFRPDVPGLQLEFLDVQQGKANVEADSWYLLYMVEAVRLKIGCEEEIKKALLRLQHSCHHYQECLWEAYRKEENTVYAAEEKDGNGSDAPNCR